MEARATTRANPTIRGALESFLRALDKEAGYALAKIVEVLGQVAAISLACAKMRKILFA
jgi:hypothetical protein